MTTVSKGDIIELKALHNPPELVKCTLEATLLLLGYSSEEAKNWKLVRGVLNGPSFLDQLKNFHAENCDPASVKKAKDLLENIAVDEVKKASAAAAQLVTWAKEAVKDCESAGKLEDRS